MSQARRIRLAAGLTTDPKNAEKRYPSNTVNNRKSDAMAPPQQIFQHEMLREQSHSLPVPLKPVDGAAGRNVQDGDFSGGVLLNAEKP